MVYNDFISGLLKDKGVSLLGFGDLSEVDVEARQGLPYGICFGIALEVFPSLGDPTKAYYDEYKGINSKLRELSFLVEEEIIKKGYRAYSLSRDVQDENFRTTLPFKTLATRAGLGWIGKNATLITKNFGNAVRLNGIITDMPFETAEPVNTSLCGDCEECVKACPAGAIKGTKWELNIDRDLLVDPFACKNKVIERGVNMGVTEGSCGICIAVCPWTKKYIEKR